MVIRFIHILFWLCSPPCLISLISYLCFLELYSKLTNCTWVHFSESAYLETCTKAEVFLESSPSEWFSVTGQVTGQMMVRIPLLVLGDDDLWHVFASQLLRFFPWSELNWDAGIEGYINLWCISSIWVLLKKTTRPVKLTGFGQVSSVSQSKKMCGSCHPIPNSRCGEKPELLWHHWKRSSLPVAKYIYYIPSNVRSWWQTLTQDL